MKISPRQRLLISDEREDNSPASGDAKATRSSLGGRFWLPVTLLKQTLQLHRQHHVAFHLELTPHEGRHAVQLTPNHVSKVV